MMKKIFEEEIEKEMKWFGIATLIFAFLLILKSIN